MDFETQGEDACYQTLHQMLDNHMAAHDLHWLDLLVSGIYALSVICRRATQRGIAASRLLAAVREVLIEDLQVRYGTATLAVSIEPDLPALTWADLHEAESEWLGTALAHVLLDYVRDGAVMGDGLLRVVCALLVEIVDARAQQTQETPEDLQVIIDEVIMPGIARFLQ